MWLFHVCMHLPMKQIPSSPVQNRCTFIAMCSLPSIIYSSVILAVFPLKNNSSITYKSWWCRSLCRRKLFSDKPKRRISKVLFFQHNLFPPLSPPAVGLNSSALSACTSWPFFIRLALYPHFPTVVNTFSLSGFTRFVLAPVLWPTRCLSLFPGGCSHQGRWSAVPDLTLGKVCSHAWEVLHLRLGTLGPSSTLHCKWCFPLSVSTFYFAWELNL